MPSIGLSRSDPQATTTSDSVVGRLCSQSASQLVIQKKSSRFGAATQSQESARGQQKTTILHLEYRTVAVQPQ